MSKKLLIASVCSAIVIAGISCAFLVFQPALTIDVTACHWFSALMIFELPTLIPNSLAPTSRAVSQVTTSYSIGGTSQPIPGGGNICPFSGPFRIEVSFAAAPAQNQVGVCPWPLFNSWWRLLSAFAIMGGGAYLAKYMSAEHAYVCPR